MITFGLGALGFLVGVGSSLLGLGGSVFIVPILPMFTGLPLREVVATSIFSIFLVSMLNVYFFYRTKMIDWKIAVKLIPVTSFFSFMGAKMSSSVDESVIKGILISIMLLMIVRLLIFKNSEVNLSKGLKNLIVYVVGAISGSFVGLTGVGNGVILGPTLLVLRLTEPSRVSPTINCMIFVSCFFATTANVSWSELSWPSAGLIRLDYALTIFFFSLFGAKLGRRINTIISERSRKNLVGILLSLVVIKLLII